MIEVGLVLLSALAASQPVTPDGWKTCPNGAQYRVTNDCPAAGPHPGLIFFDRGAADLTVRSILSLDGLAYNWQAYRRQGGTDYPIYVLVAYSDASEAEGDNLPLSRGRAREIRRYLISKGLPRDAINIMLAGPSHPQPAGNQVESEADNRLVVIWVTWRRAVR